MKIIEKKTGDLRPYENNPRKNEAAVDKVAASIKEFGFKVPLVITEDGEVVAGHTRLKAAEQLGIKKIPCVVASDLTPEQIKAFRLADNKVAEFSSWDDELLEMELGAFSEIDMSVFGFDGLEAEESPDNLEEDDFNKKKTKKHNVEAGQIWVCGKHRVMCGDSTIKEDADRLLRIVVRRRHQPGRTLSELFRENLQGLLRRTAAVVHSRENMRMNIEKALHLPDRSSPPHSCSRRKQAAQDSFL